MSVYGNFAVWALQDGQPVWADGAESAILARVNRRVRLKVLRRVAAHYFVRLPDMRQGYVLVAAVAAPTSSSPADAILRRELLPGVVQSEFVRASIPRRFAARLIDSMLLSFVWIVLSVSMLILAGPPESGSVSIGVVIMAPLGGLLGLCYEVLGTAMGGTIGKSLLGVSVIDVETGKAPGMRKSMVRYLVSAFVSWIFLLGYLWAFWNNGRTWHDMAAGTWVVRFR